MIHCYSSSSIRHGKLDLGPITTVKLTYTWYINLKKKSFLINSHHWHQILMYSFFIILFSRTNMPETKQTIKEVLPKQGLLYQEDMPTVVLCKPKILPLKSVTLEKLERMQREAQETVKQQEQQQQQHGEKDFFSDYS